jgi:predicted RNA-binding protein with PIN domain
MTLFRNFFSGMGTGKLFSNNSGAETVYLLDTSGLINSNDRYKNRTPKPNENFALLKDISLFRSKEQINLISFFLGTPLREAGDGAYFKQVRVYYNSDKTSHQKRILSLAKRYNKKHDVVVLTSDKQMEKQLLDIGVECMRHSTIAKAFPRKSVFSRPISKSNNRDNSGRNKQRSNTDNTGSENAEVLKLIDPV